jgi:hypothetical protein
MRPHNTPSGNRGTELLRGEAGGVEKMGMSVIGIEDVSVCMVRHSPWRQVGGCGLPDPKEAVVEEGEME